MLDAQMRRGFLEICVLAALAREDSYGYKIVKDMSACVSVSGGLDCDFPGLRGVYGDHAMSSINVDTTSGDLDIRKN